MKSNKNEEIFEAIVTKANRSHTTTSTSILSDLNAFKDFYVAKTSSPEYDAFDYTELKPQEAFEAYNGKIFGSLQPVVSRDLSIAREENTLEKFSRCKKELEILQVDLDTMVEAQRQGSNSQNPSLWSLLQSETNGLIATANSLENHRALEFLKKDISSTEKVLEHLILEVKNMSAPGNIFCAAKNNQWNDRTADMMSTALEERLHKLEVILGLSSNVLYKDMGGQKPFAPTFPIVDAIDRMEAKIASVENSNLESLSSKARILRNELESATKLKEKLVTETAALEATKKVEDMTTKVSKIEDVSEDLPVLASRMETLEVIHNAARTFNDRLSIMENELSELHANVKNNKEVLINLKSGIAENIETMRKNLLMMEHRVSNLKNENAANAKK